MSADLGLLGPRAGRTAVDASGESRISTSGKTIYDWLPMMAFGFSKGKGFRDAVLQLDRRLAAILAADVEGYSRLMHGDEEATMATLSARRALVDELIARHRGRIANTAGDSVLAEFASVPDAVHCAVEIQAALARANEGEPEGRQMRFRIGVNVGDVMVKEGDIFGDGVNVAARLEGLVKGGEICVSRGVHDHLRHRGGMVFEDLGEQLVKNIAHPIRAFRLRIGEAPCQRRKRSGPPRRRLNT